MTFDAVDALDELAGIGADPVRGGWSRHLLDDADRGMREWFVGAAASLGLPVARDANANLWAEWNPGGRPGPAVVTGSHLDSVPGGGAYDGPLGVVSALAAVARLQADGHVPARPVRIAVFAEEEGARFGLPCLGSRLLVGDVGPEAAARRDPAGTSLGDVLAGAGLDPAGIGAAPDRLAGIAAFVELHVEQGRRLAPEGSPIGLATGILAHGRWRVAIRGRGDHAGTTELAHRADPVLVLADLVRAARRRAAAAPATANARATVGRVAIVPGGSNAIASSAAAWLDARAESDDDVRALVTGILDDVGAAARAEGCTATATEESFSPRVDFDADLTERLDLVLGGVPRIPTGAGHDAGILAARVPSAMLFVRNPDGTSHSPHEHADDADVRAGVDALAAVLRELT